MPVVTSGLITGPAVRPLPLGAGSYNGIGWGPGSQIRVVEHKGLEESPGVVANDVKRALKHGSWAGLDTLESRIVSIVFVVLGDDNTDLRTLLAQIERAWVPGDSTDRVLWLYDSNRYLNARCRRRDITHSVGGRGAVSRVQVDWWAAHPVYRGPDLSVAVGPGLGTAGVVTVTNDGVLAAPLVVQVLGPTTNPFIVTNQTVGASLRVNRALGTGDVLELDTDLASVKVNGVYDDTALDMASSSWWDLEPGDNLIAANQPARVQFSAAWL